MRRARSTFASSFFLSALMLILPLVNYAQNREKFVISARAGGVNAVTGRASMRPHGNSEWQQLTIKEDLQTGDMVRTGVDGRVEMLLNPGSYMRIAENSEVELADNSLENLEVRLIRGTAIVEVTGADDDALFIGITTPHTRMSIVRRGLYRVNVVPGDTTELIVRKGRVMLEGSHTKVNGGNKVVFSSSSFSVAKLEGSDKKDQDTFGGWSKERAQLLAKENSRISSRTLSDLTSSFDSGWSRFGLIRSGFWFYSPGARCHTFVPRFGGWGSPYGGGYSRAFFPSGFGFGSRGPIFGPRRSTWGNSSPAGGGPTRARPANSGGRISTPSPSSAPSTRVAGPRERTLNPQ